MSPNPFLFYFNKIKTKPTASDNCWYLFTIVLHK